MTKQRKQKWTHPEFYRDAIAILAAILAGIVVLAIIGYYLNTNFLTPAGFVGIGVWTVIRFALLVRTYKLETH